MPARAEQRDPSQELLENKKKLHATTKDLDFIASVTQANDVSPRETLRWKREPAGAGQ